MQTDVESNLYPTKPTPAPIRSHEPKPRKTRPNNRRLEVPNLPINFTSDTTSDADLPRVSSVRQVIVPIPEEMRIKLGEYARKAQKPESSSMRAASQSHSGRNTPHRSAEKRLTDLDPVSNTYDLSESSRRHKPDHLPRIGSQNSELSGVNSEILANFKPDESARRKSRNRARYLDDSVFNDKSKSEEKSDESIKY